MLNMIKKYIQTREATKKDCLRFKNYIKKGCYLLSVKRGTLTFIKVSFFKFIAKFKSAYFIKGRGKHVSFTIITGTEKIIFTTDTIVISQFLDAKTSIELIKNRVELYLPKFLLPHSDYLSFDVRKKEIVTSFVPGESFSDEFHTDRLMNSLVSAGLRSEVIKGGKNKDCLLFIQHGDAYGNNVIWQDDDHFKCIDNENVGLYPAFYDAILLAAINSKNVDEFLNFNKKYQTSYESFCEKNNISFSNFFDKYLSYFIFFRMMSYPLDRRSSSHRPFAFMKDKKFCDIFPESHEVLLAISEGKNLPDLEAVYKESGHCNE